MSKKCGKAGDSYKKGCKDATKVVHQGKPGPSRRSSPLCPEISKQSPHIQGCKPCRDAYVDGIIDTRSK